MPTRPMSEAARDLRLIRAATWFAVVAAAVAFAPAPAAAGEVDDSPYLDAVVTFADNVLEHGRDVYGDDHTPLLVDGLDVTTGEPAVWRYDGDAFVLSNFASQQNLMRVLVSLSEITGDARYRDAAEAATRYMFDHHRSDCGLLYWGGHQIVDLRTQQNLGHFDADCHELKNNFPWYEFLWEVDADATQQLVRAIWNAHIFDWERLDMNRHGQYGREMGALWDHEFEYPGPFFEGRGLTFINSGTDMVHAALALHALSNESGAREWGLRLMEQYVRARDPETGLGVYQYSQPLRRRDPPTDPDAPNYTYSTFGDRAQRQFGPEFGEVALEGNFIAGGRIDQIYGRNPLVMLHVAEQLEGTDAGDTLQEWIIDGMRALLQHSYDPEENHFRPMWADGTDLTGYEIQRYGYYGDEGRTIRPRPVGSLIVLAFARAYRVSQDADIRDALRHMLLDRDFGDIGETPDDEPSLSLDTGVADADALFAVLELHRATGHAQYLKLAERIGDNIIERRFHDGYFLRSADHRYARFDDAEPLALLALEAARRGESELVPAYLAGRGYVHGRYEGRGRTTDHSAIWSRRR